MSFLVQQRQGTTLERPQGRNRNCDNKPILADWWQKPRWQQTDRPTRKSDQSWKKYSFPSFETRFRRRIGNSRRLHRTLRSQRIHRFGWCRVVAKRKGLPTCRKRIHRTRETLQSKLRHPPSTKRWRIYQGSSSSNREEKKIDRETELSKKTHGNDGTCEASNSVFLFLFFSLVSYLPKFPHVFSVHIVKQ